MKICVFAYDFPHFKSEYGLKKLISHGYIISGVIAQPYKLLNVPRSNFKLSPKLPVSGELQELCHKNSIKFLICDHDSDEAYEFIDEINPDIGVILGARILKQKTIAKMKEKILNIHPGLIPLNRGLDNFKWAIIKNLPMGNTAHFIDSKIDLGKIIAFTETKLYNDDSISDFYLRHFFGEFDLMIKALKIIQERQENLTEATTSGAANNYFSAVPDDLDEDIPIYFERYKKSNLI